MTIFRLLPLALLIAVGVGTSTAQSSPENSPANILPGNSEWLNPSASGNFLSPDFKANLNPLERILTGDYSPQLNQFGLPLALLRAELDSQVHFCLKMRVYKVARDGPNTDSIHPVSYTTCSPAARFQTHTIKGVILPTQP